MKLGFQPEEWTYLQKLYGVNVFDNPFKVEDVYFQRWINPLHERGFVIKFHLLLQKKPIYPLKNWQNEEQARVSMGFYGHFHLGLFKLSNRKLLSLNNKNIRFHFFAENEDKFNHKKVLVDIDNGDEKIIFYAKSFFVNINRV